MTTLNHPDFTLITLPDSLIDFDYYRRNPYRQSENYSLAGKVFLSTAKILSGERLELRGGSDFGFLTGSQLDSLRQLALSRKVMVLNYLGVNYNVFFDYGNNQPISADKIQLKHTNDGTDYYNNVSLRFILV